MLDEQKIEYEQKVREGNPPPIKYSKGFVPGAHNPKPPNNLKMLIIGKKVYISWNKVSGADDYVIYESKDGKKYNPRRVPIADTKFFVGFLANPKNKNVQYFGVASHYLGEISKMSVLSIGPDDFVGK